MLKNQPVWKPGFSLSQKPAKKTIVRRNRHVGKGNWPQQYEFICEYPQGYRERRLEPPSPYQPAIPSGIDPSDETSPSANIPPWTSSANLLKETSETPSAQSPDRTVDSHDDERPIQAAVVSPIPGASKDLSYTLTLSSVLYNTISHRFEPILDRYNQEFCKIPLTTDLQINPFQYCHDLNPKPPFLLHAVMALAGHHVESPSTEHHRRTALQLLREGLNTCHNMANVYHLLDTIIILFSLDETQSILGNWGIHFMGAFALLEECGGIKSWTQSSRAVVQVGLLTWYAKTAGLGRHILRSTLTLHRWDAITSLLSREDCVFPYSYFEAVLSNSSEREWDYFSLCGFPYSYFEAVLSNSSEREWDYFSLCGCPIQLVEIVMRLARLSAEKRKSSTMQYVKFDDAIVSEIKKLLESWHHDSGPTAFQDEASMHQDIDNMHCSEAWRNGLPLYLDRVFDWEPGSRVPVRFSLRARITADHVFACREDQNLVAKQALLPLFLAGCELRDESTRDKILRYCTLWDDITRYHMFNSTVPLLKEVWADQEQQGPGYG